MLTGSGTVQGRLSRRLFAEADIEPPVLVSSDNLELLLDLCTKGTGAFFCPDVQVAGNVSPEKLKQLHVIPLAHSKIEISFGYRKELRQWKPLANFISLAREKRH